MKKHVLVARIIVVIAMTLLAGCGGGGGGGSANAPGAADTTKPTVSQTSPANGATGVAVNSAISVTFSEAVDSTSVNASTFLVSGASGVVSMNGTTATFTPSSNLGYNTTYTVTLTTGIKDTTGNAMASSYSWSFTTGTAPITPPYAPTGVSANAGNAQTTISWISVSGATSYNIYWSTISGVTTSNGTIIANATSPYNHTGLSKGTTYYYIVTAINSLGESTPSSEASAKAMGWTKQLGVATKNTNSHGVATDLGGNIFVTGYTYGGLDGNTLIGTHDLFLTKYDSTGTKKWTNQLGIANAATEGNRVATDASANIFVIGGTSGGLDGNTFAGTFDFFLTKYDSTGTKQWTRQLGVANAITQAWGMAIDASGNIFVTGDTGGGLDGNTLIGTGDFFLTKYDSTGTKQWTRQLGVANASTQASGVATAAGGNIFVTGGTCGGLDGNTLTGTGDFFLTKYDSTGTRQWTRQLGVANAGTGASGVATDASGNIFVTGGTGGGLDGNTLIGTGDFFLTKYDSTGTRQWTRQLGVANASTGTSGINIDASGNIFVTGVTNGGLDGNSLTGTSDFFLTKYDSTGTKQWTRQLGVANASTQASGVATAAGGNIFVTGGTTGGLDGNTLTGTGDFFLAKYNTSGSIQ